MDSYSINDLPKFSPWPERLLSQEHTIAEKNIAEIHREFEIEKWGTLLDKVNKADTRLSIDFADSLNINPDKQLMAFQNNKLEVQTIKQIQQEYFNLLDNIFQPYIDRCSAIVDLGCGYGSVILNLAKKGTWKNKPLFAADYSKSGISIVEKVAEAEGIQIQTGLCDFTEQDVLKFHIPPGALIFTSYATFYQRYYPDSLVESLLAAKPSFVINIEPCYEHYSSDTIWGLMSRKYIEVNDYNRDILSYLHKFEMRNSIRINEIRPLVHGINPLLIASVFNWSPFKS